MLCLYLSYCCGFFSCPLYQGASAMSQGSSQTSLISSCSSSTAQSPVNLSSVSDSTGLALGESNFYLMNTASIGGITVNTCRSKEMNTNFVDEKQGSCTSISKTSNSLPSHQEGRKVDGQILNTSSKAVAREGSIPSNTEPKLSVDVKQGVPLHTLLTYQEMSTLLKMCNKPLRTASSITFEEFDILVTDVVDSCHFWANVDDKVRGFMPFNFLVQLYVHTHPMEGHWQFLRGGGLKSQNI